MNAWYPEPPGPAARPSGGIGCLAWLGIAALVCVSLFFSCCLVCVSAASAGGPAPRRHTDVDNGDDDRTHRAADEDGDDNLGPSSVPTPCRPDANTPPRPASASRGRARSLVGKICAIEVFAGTSRWLAAERSRELATSAQAYAFLKTQAKRYGKDIEVVSVPLTMDVRLDSAEEASITTPFPRERIRSLDRLVGDAQRLHNCKQAHVVVHAKVSPVPTYSHAETAQDVELAVVVHLGQPFVIAHEVLHLYGAWDLYHLEDKAFSPQTAEQAARLARLFPRDIMARVDVRNPQIGKLTAWLVGLTPCADPSFPGYGGRFGW